MNKIAFKRSLLAKVNNRVNADIFNPLSTKKLVYKIADKPKPSIIYKGKEKHVLMSIVNYLEALS